MKNTDKVALFQSVSSRLDGLTEEQKEGLCGLVWSSRSPVQSVAAMTHDRDVLLSITNGIGSQIPTGHLYAVDLESLGTEKIRIYVDPRKKHDDPIILLGYYFNSEGAFYEYKEYRPVGDSLTIDRFDATKKLIAKDEPEHPATEDDWTGPPQLLQTAKESGLFYSLFKKGLKDQTYLCVRFDL